VVGISMGDPSGIGPEVLRRALALPRVRRALVPVVFGDGPSLAGLSRLARLGGDAAPARLFGPSLVKVTSLSAKERRPGRPTAAGGRAQFAYVEAAIRWAKAGALDALCTGPVSKEQISRAGIPFMGHTEVLAERFGREVLMLMDGPKVRVALATNHLPLAQVPGALEVPRLVRQLQLLSTSLRPLLGRTPRIAVLGLNPHGGEGGLLGREEVEVLAPAIDAARRKGVRCLGPFPADGFFGKVGQGAREFDAVLAMYHDQGLVPAKALDFEQTVNVTLGLPLPRTSPDHGVAYDLAGKEQASAAPMVTALLRAAALCTPAPSERARAARRR
jgi:4-hydroxythreonine-4-phosphate dehydrogenase